LLDQQLPQDFNWPRGNFDDIEPASLQWHISGYMRSPKRSDPARQRPDKTDIGLRPGSFGDRAHCSLSG
jgi:hypothetical protein